MKYTLQDVKKSTPVPEDGYPTSVIFINLFAHRLTLLIANYTNFSPNAVTYIHLVFNLLAAVCFFDGTTLFTMIGAILFIISAILDYCDGKLARLTSRVSNKGAALDVFIDTIGKGILVVSLTYGLFRTIGNIIYLLTGMILLFIYLFPPELYQFKMKYTEGASLIMGLMETENNPQPQLNLINKLHIDRWFRYLIKRGIRPYPAETDMSLFLYFICPIIKFLGIASIFNIEVILFGLILNILYYSIWTSAFTYLVFKNIREK